MNIRRANKNTKPSSLLSKKRMAITAASVLVLAGIPIATIVGDSSDTNVREETKSVSDVQEKAEVNITPENFDELSVSKNNPQVDTETSVDVRVRPQSSAHPQPQTTVRINGQEVTVPEAAEPPNSPQGSAEAGNSETTSNTNVDIQIKTGPPDTTAEEDDRNGSSRIRIRNDSDIRIRTRNN